MPASALTPREIIADIKSLNRIEHDWLCEGRLDAVTEEDLHAKKADLLDQLREQFTTRQNELFGDWAAWDGDMDCEPVDGRFVPTIPVAYGATEIEAIETLLELIGDDA